jgi:NDP-sugar pyrophosphorylase family protein
MKAVVLAGGKGTRLAPYTTVFPKPMLPVGDRPVLEIIVRQLAYYGFDQIILSVGYLAELISAYFQNSHEVPAGVNLTCIREKEPLGTAGPIGLIPDLKDAFLVMNGDVLTTLDYSKLVSFHRQKRGLLTIGIHKRDIKIDLGIVEITDDNQVTGYNEKPTFGYYDSMGIYVYEPEVLKYIEPGVYLDLPTLVLRLIENGEKVYAYYHDRPHYWIDIGQPKDYQKANEDFVTKRGDFLPGDGKCPYPIRELNDSRSQAYHDYVEDSGQQLRTIG